MPGHYEVRVRRVITQAHVVRDYAETHYAAKSWPHLRRVVARFEATPKGLDTRMSSPTSPLRRAVALRQPLPRAGRPRT